MIPDPRFTFVVLFSLTIVWGASLEAAATQPSINEPPEIVRLRRVQDYVGALSAALELCTARGDSLAALDLHTVVALNRVASLAYEAGERIIADIALDASECLLGGGGSEHGSRGHDGISGASPPWRRAYAETMLLRGLLVRRLWNPTYALEFLRKARRALALTSETEILLGRLKQGVANCVRDSLGSEAAVAHYRAALDHRRRNLVRPHPDTADNLVWLAWNLREAGRSEEAWPLLDQAEAQLEALGMSQHSLMATILELRFDEAAISGDLVTARRLAEREVRIHEAIRAGFPVGHARGRACPPVAYRRLLWVQLQEGDFAGAFSSWQLQQAPMTTAFHRMFRHLDVANPMVQGEFRDLYGRFDRSLRILDAESLQPATRLLHTLAALKAWAALQRRLQEFDAAVGARVIHPDSARRTLPARTAFLGAVPFQLGGTSVRNHTVRRQDRWLLVILPDEQLRWIEAASLTGDRLSIRLQDDDKLRRMLTRAINWPTRIQADSELEWRMAEKADEVLGAAGPHLEDIETVVSVGTDLFALFAYCRGLPSVVSLAPSLEIYVESAARAATLPSEPSILAIGASGEGLRAPLLNTDAELDMLRERFANTRVMRNSEAMAHHIEALDRCGEIADLDIVHFACHADASVNPLRSALLLGRDGDGRISRIEAGELLYEFNMRPGLVVLSGCSTARGVGRMWGEYHSLTQAFIGRGAARVLASRWDVDDEATALFMKHFYAALGGEGVGRRSLPVSPAAAVARAARLVREHRAVDGSRPFAHPIYWAGFTLYGAP